MAISSTTAAASTGVATVSGVSLSGVQLTIDPGTVAGDVTFEAKPIGLTAYEDVLDSAGVALSVSAPSAQVTYFISGHFEAVRATSSNTGDTFDLVVIGNDHVDAADIRAAVGLSTANLDTQLSAIDTVTGALPDSGALTSLATAAALATVDSNVDAILVDTNELQINQGNWVTATGFATASQVATVDVNVDAILVDTSTTLPGAIAGVGSLDAEGLRTALGLATANLDTQLGAIDTVVDAVLVDTGTTIPNAISTLPSATENADALLNRDMSEGADTNTRSPRNALRLLRNKWNSAGGTWTIYKEDDTTTAWSASLTSDAAANPVTGSDPA